MDNQASTGGLGFKWEVVTWPATGEQFKLTTRGTYYDPATPDDVIDILETAIWSHREYRFIITCGDPATGIADRAESDAPCTYGDIGYIGRTIGRHSPIICFNSRSMGGGLISTQNILRIQYANKRDGGIIYDRLTAWAQPDR